MLIPLLFLLYSSSEYNSFPIGLTISSNSLNSRGVSGVLGDSVVCGGRGDSRL
jgi:hypothetical protein